MVKQRWLRELLDELGVDDLRDLDRALELLERLAES